MHFINISNNKVILIEEDVKSPNAKIESLQSQLVITLHELNDPEGKSL